MKTSNKAILRIFLQYLRPYRWLVVVGIASGVVSQIAAVLVQPYLFKGLVDAVAVPFSGAPVQADTIFFLFGLLVVDYLIMWVAFRATGVILGRIETNVTRDLSVMSLSATLRQPHGFFQDQFSGALMRKINRFSDSLERLLEAFWWNVIPVLFTLIVVAIVFFREHILLGIGMIAWVTIFIVINFLVATKKMKVDLARSAKNTAMHATMSDIVTNATTVKTFASEAFESERFYTSAEEARQARWKSWIFGEINWGAQFFLTLAFELIVIYIALTKWHVGAMTVGTFVLYQTFVMRIEERIAGVHRVIRDFYESLADAKETMDLIETPPDVRDKRRAKPIVVTRGAIECANVGFTYNKTRRVLDGFDLAIAPREKIALVGPSGAGKSTVVKLLFRFYDVDRGKILIDGQSIADVTQQSLRNAIALVPQEPVLFHRTLKENIRYGCQDATDEEVIAAAKKAHAHEFIQQAPEGYDTFVGERGIKLSGGERQRVAIARAILKNAPILVLDEATSSLDSESEMLIQDALRELMKEKTVIVIAHRLSTIMQMDRIVVMEEGKVVDQGTHDDLLKKVGTYQKLWNIQAGGFLPT